MQRFRRERLRRHVIIHRVARQLPGGDEGQSLSGALIPILNPHLTDLLYFHHHPCAKHRSCRLPCERLGRIGSSMLLCKYLLYSFFHLWVPRRAVEDGPPPHFTTGIQARPLLVTLYVVLEFLYIWQTCKGLDSSRGGLYHTHDTGPF